MKRHGWIAAALGAMVWPAIAQQIPDAGRLLEEVRPVPRLPRERAPTIRPEEVPAAEADGTRIHVARLRVTGATRFTSDELHALVAEAEGKDLSLGDLQGLAQRITRYYRQHGYLLARAYLPAQEVRQGEVEIAVSEARLGQVKVDNNADLGGAALAPLRQVRSGDVAEESALERSLLLLSDLPGTQVMSTLHTGKEPGTTDLQVDLMPGSPIVGSVEADDQGDRYSGQFRLGADLNLNNPFHVGDVASLRALTSDEGLAYARLGYQLPVNRWGTRIGLAASNLRYYLGARLAPLRASGKADTGSVYVLHPFVRSRTFNVNGQLQYERLDLDDRVGATGTQVKKSSDRWIAGISGDLRDGWGGGGVDGFSLLYTSGHLRLDAETRAQDALTARTAGSYAKWNASWLRLQGVTDAVSLYAALSAQWASKNLDSSEKMILGGANGVRAYPQGEAAGDEGTLLVLEARYQMPMAWPGLWQATLFLDSGHVRSNQRPWSSGDNSRTLTGAGLGLNVASSNGWSVKTSLAWRVGSARPQTGDDHTPRAWLQVVKTF